MTRPDPTAKPEPAVVRATLYLQADLHQALRLKAAQGRRSMSDIVNEALRQALREDQQDLSTAALRAAEPSVSYAEFLDLLKADGTL